MAETTTPLHNVDLRLLRIFKQVVESRGFSAAEETLGIGRSTISKHIGDLEIRLGLRLCERGRSGFRISPHGETVYRATVELLDALEQFQARVSHATQRLSGELSLWLMDNTLREVGNPVSLALRRLRDRPGELHLTVNVTTPDAVEQAVASRLAHVGLTICNSALPGLVYSRIGDETSSLYCAKSHPLFGNRNGVVEESELLDANFVARGYLISLEAGRLRQEQATALHVEGTLQLLLAGDFVAVVPDHIAKPWVDRGLLVGINCGTYRRSTPIFLVTRQQSLDLDSVKAVLTDMTEAYSAQAVPRAQ